MSATKSRGEGRWGKDFLRLSDVDTVTFNEELKARFIQLTKDYLKARKVPLNIPKDLDSDMLLWRTLAARHAKGDRRHTLDETKAMQRVAEWTLRVKGALTGQELPIPEWRN